MREKELIHTFAKEHVIRASGLLSLLMPQASGLGICVKDMGGRYQLANDAMEALFGISVDQIISATDDTLFHPRVAAQLKQSDQQILDGATGTSSELQITVDDAPMRYLWIKFPVLSHDATILFIGSVILDLARQENFAGMRHSLARLHQTNVEMERILERMDSLASTDKLTGVWNRPRMEEAALNEMDRLQRYGHPLSMLVIDIDPHATDGDESADERLVAAAIVLQAALRVSDSLARWEGGRFLVLCPNTTRATADILADRLLTGIAKAASLDPAKVSARVGVAQCLAGENREQWFDRAQASLWAPPAAGRALPGPIAAAATLQACA